MNRKRVWVVCAMLFASQSIHAATRYVDVAAGGSNNGTSWANAYTNLQTALTAAASNDAVWVASGTYKPGASRTDTFQLKADVPVYGGFTNGMAALGDRDWLANVTILSGEIGTSSATDNVRRVVTGASRATLDGFTVKRAYHDTTGGGGIQLSGVVGVSVRNCTFTENEARNGGGALAQSGATVTFEDTIFVNNTAAASSMKGGALYVATATTTVSLERCSFIENSAENQGGAIYLVSGSVIAEDCLFVRNESVNSSGGAIGNASGTLTLDDSIVSDNQCSSTGGGIFLSSGSGTIRRTYLSGSVSGSSGGGIYAISSPTLRMENCLVAGNEANGGSSNGGGLYFQSLSTNAIVINATIVRNYAGSKGGSLGAVNSQHDMVNSILWANQAGSSGSEVYNSSASQNPDFSFCIVTGGINGATFSTQDVTDDGANLSGDPLFGTSVTATLSTNATYDATTGIGTLTSSGAAWTAGAFAGRLVNPDLGQRLQYYIVGNTTNTLTFYGDATAFAAGGDTLSVYDYRPSAGSPAIDWATSAGAPATDITGVARPQGSGGDVGAYEVTVAVPAPARGPITRFK